MYYLSAEFQIDVWYEFGLALFFIAWGVLCPSVSYGQFVASSSNHLEINLMQLQQTVSVNWWYTFSSVLSVLRRDFSPLVS
jgi:hypothetical protein